MGFRETKVGALLRQGKDADAAKVVDAALTAEGGNATRAAERLGVSHDQLTRWIARLEGAGHRFTVERLKPGRPPRAAAPARTRRRPAAAR